MRVALPLLAAVIAAVPSALAADPGVSADEIVIGGTAPISGPESAYAVVAQGAKAYFDYVNANGGVFGRDIRYVYLDDAYDPAQTVQQTRRLVEQERVFAIFNVVGTEHTLATRPYLNQLGIPQLYVGSGATAIVREAGKYPWTLPYLPSFFAEGRFYGRNVAATRPKATIAVLYEDSDFGKDLLRGLRAGLKGKGKIVATQGYAVTEADVSSQIAALRASKANTLMIFALPKQTIQSFIASDKLGWRPKAYVAAVSIDPFVMEVARLNTGNRTTEGATSLAFLKDATNKAKWGKDAGVKLYLSIMKRFNSGGDPNAVANMYGMAAAHTMVETLRKAGRSPTRKKLLNAATHLTSKTNPFLLPGIVVKTGAGDRYPLDQLQLYRYTKGVWRTIGPLVSTR
ncbi:MAG TPA: ABC transporter substrate-binding protein [Gaiellaceae bacterium]|nr:ABC transporter substrate-binding protein [Gaiellaceae bacterium]